MYFPISWVISFYTKLIKNSKIDKAFSLKMIDESKKLLLLEDIFINSVVGFSIYGVNMMDVLTRLY